MKYIYKLFFNIKGREVPFNRFFVGLLFMLKKNRSLLF